MRLVADWLPDSVATVDLGEHQLRDIPTRTRLFQLSPAGQDAAFGPPRTLGGAGSLTTSVRRAARGPRARRRGGRGRRADHRRRPTRDPHRPGGVGKTTLATAAVAVVADSFPRRRARRPDGRGDLGRRDVGCPVAVLDAPRTPRSRPASSSTCGTAGPAAARQPGADRRRRPGRRDAARRGGPTSASSPRRAVRCTSRPSTSTPSAASSRRRRGAVRRARGPARGGVSSSTRPTPRRSASSARRSTGCPWPWRSPRRGSSCSRRRRCSRGSTPASTSRPATGWGRAARPRCATRSPGPTTCSTPAGAACWSTSVSSSAARRSRRSRPSCPPRSWVGGPPGRAVRPGRPVDGRGRRHRRRRAPLRPARDRPPLRAGPVGRHRTAGRGRAAARPAPPRPAPPAPRRARGGEYRATRTVLLRELPNVDAMLARPALDLTWDDVCPCRRRTVTRTPLCSRSTSASSRTPDSGAGGPGPPTRATVTPAGWPGRGLRGELGRIESRHGDAGRALAFAEEAGPSSV